MSRTKRTTKASMNTIFMFCHHIALRSPTDCFWNCEAWLPSASDLSTSSSRCSPRSTTASMFARIMSVTSPISSCTRCILPIPGPLWPPDDAVVADGAARRSWHTRRAGKGRVSGITKCGSKAWHFTVFVCGHTSRASRGSPCQYGAPASNFHSPGRRRSTCGQWYEPSAWMGERERADVPVASYECAADPPAGVHRRRDRGHTQCALKNQ
eukprot:scaffold65059_cov65-Phaeocystis_antarctica.AAC.8